MSWKKKRIENQIDYKHLALTFIGKYPNGMIIDKGGLSPTYLYDHIWYNVKGLLKEDVNKDMVQELIQNILETKHYRLLKKDVYEYFYIDSPKEKVITRFNKEFLTQGNILDVIFSQFQESKTNSIDINSILYYHHGIMDVCDFSSWGKAGGHRKGLLLFFNKEETRKEIAKLLQNSAFFHKLIMRVFDFSNKDFIIHAQDYSYIINAQGKSANIMQNDGTMSIFIGKDDGYTITHDSIQKIEWNGNSVDFENLRNINK